jgi:uncharacterized protein with FMN-binding domain
MAKPLPSYVLLGFTAIVSFSVLFVTNLITEPILINRENQAELTLLNLSDLGDYTVESIVVSEETLIDAGITHIKTFSQNSVVDAVTYTVMTTGYSVNLNYRIGIRDGLIQQFKVVSHGETIGYGADALLLFPDALNQIAIDDASAWTAALVSVSTGATFTRRGIIDSLQAIQVDYAARTV